MNVLCVDDEPIVLEETKDLLQRQKEISTVSAFLSPREALLWASKNRPDAAFLDISMARMDGLTLAKKIKDIAPDCAIVFITGYSQYAVNAFSLHADGYLLKPITEKDIKEEVSFILSRGVLPVPQTGKAIRVQCFGNFEVYADGKPLSFKRGKTKELLAYLVDRQGAMMTMKEVAAVLWEEEESTESKSGYLRNLICDLKDTLKSLGVDDVLEKRRNAIGLNCDAVDCDYYDFLRRIPYAVNLYRGEYMSQYSWAELTAGSLE